MSSPQPALPPSAIHQQMEIQIPPPPATIISRLRARLIQIPLFRKLHSFFLAKPKRDEATTIEKQPLYIHYAKIIDSLTKYEYDMLQTCLYTPAQQSSNQIDDDDWDEVAGLRYTKQTLHQIMGSFLSKSEQGPLFNAPKGVMLYGPPGCGKTLLAKNLAKYSRKLMSMRAKTLGNGDGPQPGLTFLVAAPSTFLRKYVGETSRMVKTLFTLSKKVSPCLVFMDEIDSIFRSRGADEGASDVYRDLKTEFMQLWDGMGVVDGEQSSTDERLLIIGATNRPFDVDPAIQRRMPRSFFVGLPTKTERVEIIKKLLTKTNKVPLARGLDFNAVATNTEGYSGSDLKELCRCAVSQPMNELQSQQGKIVGFMDSTRGLRPLNTNDFRLSLGKIVPTQFESLKYRNRLEQYENQIGGQSPKNCQWKDVEPMELDQGEDDEDEVDLSSDDGD